jgi:hypothetical protein
MRAFIYAPLQLNGVFCGHERERGVKRVGALFGMMLTTLMAPAASSESHSDFSRVFTVDWVQDGYWNYCEASVVVDERGDGVGSGGCGTKGQPIAKPQRQLSSAEVGELRGVLRDAGLFEGQFWGTDQRGIDLALVTISVNAGSRAMVLVCSGNPTCETGARLHLMQIMTKLTKSRTPNAR